MSTIICQFYQLEGQKNQNDLFIGVKVNILHPNDFYSAGAYVNTQISQHSPRANVFIYNIWLTS